MTCDEFSISNQRGESRSFAGKHDQDASQKVEFVTQSQYRVIINEEQQTDTEQIR